MGFFDGLTNVSFKKSADGQNLFYPYGIIGRGYIIPTEAEYEKLRKSYKTIIIVSFLIIFIAGPLELLVIPVLFGYLIFMPSGSI